MEQGRTQDSRMPHFHTFPQNSCVVRELTSLEPVKSYFRPGSLTFIFQFSIFLLRKLMINRIERIKA